MLNFKKKYALAQMRIRKQTDNDDENKKKTH